MRMSLVAAVAIAAALAVYWADPFAVASKKPAFVQTGTASWYGPGFDGKETASGEIFDSDELVAAHRKLPLGTQVTVTNLDNGSSVEVEIIDRGPYSGGRIIDLSKRAAKKIGMVEDGTAKVRVETVEQPSAEASGGKSERR
jgi:rare lipoprotein A